jgi:hypothetical protein
MLQFIKTCKITKYFFVDTPKNRIYALIIAYP